MKVLLLGNKGWIGSMMSSIFTERRINFQQYYDKVAFGDLVTDIKVQFTREEKHKVESLVRLGFRFPTSSGVGAARYTDNTGYYQTLSIGKKIIKKDFFYLKAIGEIGFLS